MPLLSLVAALAVATQAAADSTTYVVVNHGRPAGGMTVVRTADSLVARYGHIDRNRGRWVETRYRLDGAGAAVSGEARNLDRHGTVGDVLDRFEVAGDSARSGARAMGSWTRPITGTFVGLRGGTAFEQALLARHLLRQPQRSAALLGGGTARVEVAADTVVTTADGPRRVRWALLHTGTGGTPAGVWLDERDELFASDVGWFITVRRGAEGALPTLRAIEMRRREADAAALARRVAPKPASAIVIRNANLFDSERGTMRPRTTIVVRGDRIVAVGPADSVRTPAGATVIDAAGRTVIPGLWEMHGHLQLTSQTAAAPLQLAQGITTMRDLAADTDVAVSQRDRADAGTIASPRLLLGGFMEGPGDWAGPSDAIVRTEHEARAMVARYDSLGYRQIKLYNLIHPDLVPTIADETHRRGMRLSGHVPRGLSVPAALALGFDEINHVAFLFSTFYQDSLYLPEMRPYSGVAAAVAHTIDVDGAPMTALIAALRARGTVLDGTFNLWAMADTSGDGEAAARAKRANANYRRLIARLYEAGVPLVPGTDNFTSGTYVAELELYEAAGIPAAAVLQMATIGSARVMKEDSAYGSIAPGKVADLVLIDGRPAERIGDLRNVEQVMRAGRLYDPGALTEAAGRGRRQRAQRAERR